MTCSIAQPLGFPVDRYRVCLQILPNPGFKARRSHWRQSEWQNGCHLQHVHLPQALPHCNRMFRGKSTCPSRTRPTKGKSAMKSGSWLAQIYIFERILTKRIFPQLVSETSEFVFPLNSENFVSEKSGLRVNPQQMSHIIYGFADGSFLVRKVRSMVPQRVSNCRRYYRMLFIHQANILFRGASERSKIQGSQKCGIWKNKPANHPGPCGLFGRKEPVYVYVHTPTR